MAVGVSEVQRALRSGHPLSLLVVDIDLFKQVNDTWGHPVGDLCRGGCLCAGRAVRCRYCRSDRRRGIRPYPTENHAYQLAERLCASVAVLPIAASDNQVLSVTVNIGVASLSHRGTSFRDLLIRADRALYGAKDLGQNGVYLLPA